MVLRFKYGNRCNVLGIVPSKLPACRKYCVSINFGYSAHHLVCLTEESINNWRTGTVSVYILVLRDPWHTDRIHNRCSIKCNMISFLAFSCIMNISVQE